MGFSEKRKYPRVDETVACQLTVNGATFSAQTANLSCGGALCLFERSVAPMTQLEISFQLSGSSTRMIRCIGVVVRQQQQARGFSTAIYFSDLRQEDRRHIAEFVLRSMLSHDRRSA